jgi:hypothetical protein
MRKTTLVLLAAWALPALLAGQGMPGSPGARGFVSTGASFQRWSFDQDVKPLQELAFPLTAVVPVNPSLFITVSNTPGSAKWDTLSIGGASDTWIRGTYTLSNQRVLFTAGIAAPTGKTKLKIDSTGWSQFGLSQALGENLLRFRLPVFGQGFSAKVGAAFAAPLSPSAVFGAGVNAIFRSKYKPVDVEGIEYKAGNETSVYAGLDLKAGARARWSLNFNYTMYGKDKLNDSTVFGSGGKILVNTAVSAEMGKGVLSGSLSWRQRGKNEYWVETSLQAESKNSNGSLTELDAAYRFPSGPKTTLGILASGRFQGKNGYGAGGANALGGGAGIQHALSPKVSVQADLLYLSGKRSGTGGLKLSGLDFMGALTFGL